jgi:hypothetical protein
MLMSDLMGTRVVDADDVDLGKVFDIRLVQDGPYLEGFGHALRVDALVVGTRSLPERLGYVRGGVRGPTLIRRLSSAIEARSFMVDWSHVEIGDGIIRVRRSTSEMKRVRASVEEA